MPNRVTQETVLRLGTRAATRTEADIQSDVRTLLIAGDLDIAADEAVSLEDQLHDGTRRRIDISICHAVIEVKRDLRNPAARAEAEAQLEGYVTTRREQHGRRFVGLLTDGVEWVLYDVVEGGFTEVARITNAGDADGLVVWLEAILASQDQVAPTPKEIEQRLGARSPAYLLDVKELSALWQAHGAEPELTLKRHLWAKLLRTAFGESFTNDDATFINHTLLVLIAEAIAHAVVGLDPATQVTPSELVAGTAFDAMGIHGVVEQDFFDWVVDVDGGDAFIRTLASRITKFDWSNVEHDVLKHLYESIITQEAREGLGEYYTPDWLADRIVASAVVDPLAERVLDPSCGSGTFVFHAVRAYLDSAEAADAPATDRLRGLTNHVLGMDIHPVAVTLARVTYLLAIGGDRLKDPQRPEFSVPIYLGDSLQWEQDPSLFSRDDAFSVDTTGDHLTGAGGGMLFQNDLVFPLAVLANAAQFDRLVSRMADLALEYAGRKTETKTLMLPVLNQFSITDGQVRETLIETFTVLRDLARSGRDHIWGYYVRNLIRPVWLALPENRVDVLVGNPPWLRYSKMTASMQERYLDLARPRNLLSGPLGASGRDLATLFVTRAVEKYLNPGGRFSFVMPHGTLTRLPHTGFRSGDWASSGVGDLVVQWGRSRDLIGTPTGFPMTSCVVSGSYDKPARAMSSTVDEWISTSRRSDQTWEQIEPTMTIVAKSIVPLDSDAKLPISPYKSKFRQGAILVPRVLITVEDAPALPYGAGAGRHRVQSRRTKQEKAPWKTVATIVKTVETEHVYPVYLGESVGHFRTFDPIAAVIPLGPQGLLTPTQIAQHPGLSDWWSEAETKWSANKRPNDTSDFLTRIDFHGQLSAQVPVAEHRVVYTKSGSTLAAARIEDSRAIIDHKLYWSPVDSVEEGRYLTGILNSETLLTRVRPLQNVGLFGPRDFDKNVFYVPFGPYSPTNAGHTRLVALVAEAETAAAAVAIGRAFTSTRTKIRKALSDSGLVQQIEDAVSAILPIVE